MLHYILSECKIKTEVIMRRKDRQMPKEFALQVVDKCDYAVLSMISDNKPYCLPITIVRDQDNVYFHCAKAGQKYDALLKNPDVCLACVGDVNVVPQHFTTEYESAVIKGKATLVTDDEQKIKALKILCQRYTPSNMGEFDNAIKMSLDRTAIFKISIDQITGKRKKYDKNGEEMKFGRME